MTRDKAEALLAWHRLLLGMAGDIVYRIASREPTDIFFRELAESLESLAARVRRELSN